MPHQILRLFIPLTDTSGINRSGYKNYKEKIFLIFNQQIIDDGLIL